LAALVSAAALPSSVVITMGGEGALVCSHGQVQAVPAPPVDVVDTTGAGDTFVGALADALSRDEPLVDAVRWAVCAASLSTGALGATTGMPRREQVEAMLATTPEAPSPREAPMS
jgi:ribokinase